MSSIVATGRNGEVSSPKDPRPFERTQSSKLTDSDALRTLRDCGK